MRPDSSMGTTGDVAIRVDRLNKQYRIAARREGYQTLRDALVKAVTAPWRLTNSSDSRQKRDGDLMFALKDVSFEVARGEVVGVIGRNGAGKSTLLKILSRVTEPTSGYADIHGRVGSLLEVGTGFHPELSGRENIYLNGAILGMARSEIDRNFDDIVAFAEVERFVDTPVKHYSSGMYLRLAFAVAAHLEPEVLLVDEVLAVGDTAFQRKCLGKMGSVAQSGRTVLLVSHNMTAIASLCQRTIVLGGGQCLFYGDTDTAIKYYSSDCASASSVDLTTRRDREGDGRVRIQRVDILDDSRRTTDIVQSGSDVMFSLHYGAIDDRPLRNVLFEVKVTDRTDSLLFTLSTFLTGESFDELPPFGTVQCHVPSLLLAPGEYSLRLICYVNNELADQIWNAGTLSVAEADFYGGGKAVRSGTYGPVLMPQRWQRETRSPVENVEDVENLENGTLVGAGRRK